MSKSGDLLAALEQWYPWVEKSQWKVACGPLNLRETIGAFLTWARAT